MRILVNGGWRDVPGGTDVASLLRELSLEPRRDRTGSTGASA